jgi:hypothetical protein
MTVIFAPSGLRTASYRKHWPALVNTYGQACYYCGEFATCIDHVIPASYGGSNDFDNLVLSCALCNLLASDIVFDDVEEKRLYILKRRAKGNRLTRTICTDCLMPYEYRVGSPSLFLCAECYDLQLECPTYAMRPAWHRWLKELEAADIPVEIHRQLRDMHFSSRERKLVALTQMIFVTGDF